MNRHILCAFLCALIAPAAEGTSTLNVYATNSSDCVLTNVHAVNVTTDDCGSSTIHTFDGDIPAHSKVSVLSVLFGGFGCSAHGAHGLISSPDQFSYSWSLGPSEGRVDVFEVAGDSCSVTNTQDPNNGDDPCRETGCQSCPGMPVWRVAEPYTTLWINDEPLGYKPAAGPPISFRLAFKQRDQIAGFDTNVFGTGKKWGLSWLSYVCLDSSGSNVVYFPGGRQRKFLGTNDYLTDATLTGNTTSGFTLNYPSGAKTVYGLVVTNTLGGFLKAFMTEDWNANSQRTLFTYHSYNPADPVIRLDAVVDADGRTNVIHYNATNSYSTNLISEVIDPFGRKATLGYDAQGHVTNLTDTEGMSSSLGYDTNDIVSSLQTPYGTFGFTVTGTNNSPDGRSVLVTRPDGSRELYLCKESAPGIPWSFPTNEIPVTTPFTNTFENSQMSFGNTFYWGPRQYLNLSTTNIASFTTNDFRKARLRHWLKEDFFNLSETLSMERQPSPDAGGTTEGQKTWYDYAGKGASRFTGSQHSPLFVAHLNPGGTTYFSRTARNFLGATTNNVSTFSVNGTVILRTNSYTYAANGIDLITETNALGVLVSSNSYNSAHQVLTNFNALGERTVYTYNANQQLSSITTPSGLIATNSYDSEGHMVSTIDYAVIGGTPVFYRTNTFTYLNDLVYTHTDERGLVTTTLYDNLNRLTNSSDARGAVSYFYDKLDLARVTDRMGNTTSFGYDSMRRKVAETNGLGFYSLYSYCSCGSLDAVQDREGYPTYFYYDNQARLTNVAYPDGYSVTNFLDLLGRTTNTCDSAGVRITNWFNNQGLLEVVSNAVGRVQLTLFDALDRATNATDIDDVTISSTYDALNRLKSRTHPDSGVEQFGYSTGTAPATSYTNEIGHVTRYGFDPLGRKIAETNANSEVLQFTYSGAGDLLSLTDPKNHTTQWHYDVFGRVTNKVDQTATEILRYAYDPNDRLTNRWSAEKGNTKYSYDAVGNLVFIDYPSAPDVAFGYDAMNRRTNMVDYTGTTVWGYTAAGQMRSEAMPFASSGLTNTFVNRRRVGLTLEQPTGVWTNGFGYDSANRMTNVTSPAGTFSYLFASSGMRARPQQINLPSGSRITNYFDSSARLVETSLRTSGGTVRDSYTYVYNTASQRTLVTRDDTSTVAYTYDPLGQLIGADGSVNTEDRGYGYDKAWNLTNRNAEVFQVNSKNELTADPYSLTNYYDANGNLISRWTSTFELDPMPLQTFSYDDENRLVSLVSQYTAVNTGCFAYEARPLRQTDFFYDGLGRLLVKTDSTYGEGGCGWGIVSSTSTVYIYDGMRVIQERDGNNTPMVCYTRGPDLSSSMEGAGGIGGLLARSEADGAGWTNHACYFAHGNGNITALLDQSETLVAYYRYDSFGNTIWESGALADDNVYRFSSKEIHPPTGMYYYGYRFYVPWLQRWVNRDPLFEVGGRNLYAFVGNDPVTGFDAMGLYKAGTLPPSDRINTIVCKGGKAVPKLKKGSNFTPCVTACLKVHERSHADEANAQNACAGAPDGVRVVTSSPAERVSTEIAAYSAEIKCYDGFLPLAIPPDKKGGYPKDCNCPDIEVKAAKKYAQDQLAAWQKANPNDPSTWPRETE